MSDDGSQSPEQQKAMGLECPRCGCRHLPVVYTRPGKKWITRVRRCRYCDRRVVTREQTHGLRES